MCKIPINPKKHAKVRDTIKHTESKRNTLRKSQLQRNM